jgi:hypothetical protein
MNRIWKGPSILTILVFLLLYSCLGSAQKYAAEDDSRQLLFTSVQGKSAKKSSKRSSTPTAKIPSSGKGPSSSQCMDQFSAVFLQFSATPPAIYNDPNVRDAQVLGTRYVYNDDLRYIPSLDSIPGSRASGTCTRTQSRIGNNQIGLQLGMGHCQFTYRISNGGRELIFTASGEVSDITGGVLPITGGSKASFGAYGEVKLEPVTVQSNGSIKRNDGDFFLDANFYRAEVSIVFPCI